MIFFGFLLTYYNYDNAARFHGTGNNGHAVGADYHAGVA